MKWMVVSFFTPDDIYRNHAAGLRASCEQFGIEHDIEELKGTGDWPSNVKMKAPFILRKMNEHPERNIVWIDADGRVRQYPKLFDELDCNVACHWRKDTELLSGTMFFGNNPKTVRLIEAWLLEQSKYTMFAEQRSLDALLKRGGGWDVVKLPASYTLIFDSMRHLGPPVIEHLQASRQAYWRRGRTRHGASVAALRERISRLQMGKSKGAKVAAVPTQRIGSGIPDFEKNYPNAKTAALLQGQLKGMPCVIMGNSSSLNRMNLATLTQFPTVGCNRILRMFNPDYYIVVDREPYVQDLELIRKFPGIRVLSSTIYNEKTKCHRVPVQPIPDFDFYHFRACCTKGIPRRGYAGHLPIIETEWRKDLASAGNIAFPMLQLAIMLGANPIGIAGIDLVWKSRENSHFFGNGSKAGCFPFATARLIAFFREAARWCRNHKIEIYNLSPEGMLNAFPRMSDREFHRKFIGNADRVRVRDRKFAELKPIGRDEAGRRVPLRRYKPPAAPSRAAIHDDFGQGRVGGGSSAAAYFSLHNSVVQRARAIRKARAARKAAILMGRKAQKRPVPAPPRPEAKGLPVLGEQQHLCDRGGGPDGCEGNKAGGH